MLEAGLICHQKVSSVPVWQPLGFSSSLVLAVSTSAGWALLERAIHVPRRGTGTARRVLVVVVRALLMSRMALMSLSRVELFFTALNVRGGE
jgi:hypothetical protein